MSTRQALCISSSLGCQPAEMCVGLLEFVNLFCACDGVCAALCTGMVRWVLACITRPSAFVCGVGLNAVVSAKRGCATLHTTSAPLGPLLEFDGACYMVDGCCRHWGGGFMLRMAWPPISTACVCQVPRVKLTTQSINMSAGRVCMLQCSIQRCKLMLCFVVVLGWT